MKWPQLSSVRMPCAHTDRFAVALDGLVLSAALSQSTRTSLFSVPVAILVIPTRPPLPYLARASLFFGFPLQAWVAYSHCTYIHEELLEICYS